MTKKLIVAVVIIGAFVIYSFMYHSTNQMAVVPNINANSSRSTITATVPATTGSSGTNPPTTSTPTSTGSARGQYKDGSYTGSVADAGWGSIQVKAIIQNGKIQDVQFLQYPNDRNQSIAINQYADPQLTSEAIQAQSAQVNIVSGATDSSDAFIQSLTDALSQAKA
jgi:Uncharacterized protein conserved in bacteria